MAVLEVAQPHAELYSCAGPIHGAIGDDIITRPIFPVIALFVSRLIPVLEKGEGHASLLTRDDRIDLGAVVGMFALEEDHTICISSGGAGVPE